MFVGLVVALHGKETGAGDFMVEDILEAGLPHQIELPLNFGRSRTISMLLSFITVILF